MHILFLTDNFPPEVNAPASRTFEHCREWVKAGHEVTVLTCAPNFPKGRVFPGYRNKLWQSEEMEGVRVIRVWSYIVANEGFARRTLDYLSYMMSAIAAAPFVRRVDLVIGTSPQFFTPCAAYVVSRLKRIPFVFELRDLWPESIRAAGAMRNSSLLDTLDRIALFLYRKADLIVSVTHSFRSNLAERGIERAKIAVVTNGSDLSFFTPRAKDAELVRALGLEGKFVAGYIGTQGLAHALETVLEAARLLQEADARDIFRIIMLGDGASKAGLVARAREMKLRNVLFIDTVPKEQVPRYWSLLDVSIIHLKKTPLFTTVIPSKLFECMSMGIPVLHGVEGESAEIVERDGVGLTFEPENAAALADGLRMLSIDTERLARWRENGLRAAKRYSRSTLARAMLGHLVRLAPSPARAVEPAAQPNEEHPDEVRIVVQDRRPMQS